MKKINFTIILQLIAGLSFTQIHNTGYLPADNTKGFGESEMSSMLSAADGSVVTVHNYEESNGQTGSNDVQVLKVDQLGNVLWSRDYGQVGMDDKIYSIAETDSGGYMLVGTRGKIQGSYRHWTMVLDALGNVMMEHLVFDSSNGMYDATARVVARTSEAAETYFVAGVRACTACINSSNQLNVMKVNAMGMPIWNKIYSEYGIDDVGTRILNPDLVTSMVEDPTTLGFVLTGITTDENGFGEFNTGRSCNVIWTIGIDLSGAIFNQYKQHEINPPGLGGCSVVLEPHINVALDGSSFVIAAGLRGSIVDGSGTGAVVYLPLSPTLTTINNARLYYPERGSIERGNSIYPDPAGFYAIGCTADRTDNTLYTTDEDRIGFLKIDAGGDPIDFHTYISGSYPASSFMTQKVNQTGYVLKTDMTHTGVTAIGLIHTDLSGASDCTIRRQVTTVDPLIETIRETYVPIDWVHVCTMVPSGTWPDPVARLNCTELTPIGVLPRSAKAKAIEQLRVYPNLINDASDELTIEIDLVQTQRIEFQIVGSSGRILHSGEKKCQAGYNSFKLDPNVFDTGINIVRVKAEAQTDLIRKVVKM